MNAPESDRGVTSAKPGEAEELLLCFLREHEALCPVCGYNLKGLDRPVCPECRHDLVLSVGVHRIGIGWLLIALAPGCFSGMAACVLAVPTIGVWMEDGMLIPPFAGAVLFGWSSGLFAVLLAVKRTRFLVLPRPRQRQLAALVWLAHFVALGLLIYTVAPYFN